MKKHLYNILILFVFTPLIAQQSSQFTQSADQFGLDNPAGLSIEEMRIQGTTVNLYFRNQWWNFETSGYPQNQTITWLYNGADYGHFGAAIVSDKIGETQQFGIKGRYAHRLSENLKLGLSAGMFSKRIFIQNLDRYDNDDELIATAGDTKWRLSVTAGLFYHTPTDQTLNWFAGVAFRRSLYLSDFSNLDTSPNETDLLAQGGIGLRGWWVGSRLRWSLKLPSALDLYARYYFPQEDDGPFMVGAIVTSDAKRYVGGAQIGYELKLRNSDNYFTFNLGFSKPLFSYIYGDQLIFDGRVTWAME